MILHQTLITQVAYLNEKLYLHLFIALSSYYHLIKIFHKIVKIQSTWRKKIEKSWTVEYYKTMLFWFLNCYFISGSTILILCRFEIFYSQLLSISRLCYISLTSALLLVNVEFIHRSLVDRNESWRCWLYYTERQFLKTFCIITRFIALTKAKPVPTEQIPNAKTRLCLRCRA